MKHLGDITKINGAEVEPVWVIIGGSPCQDLSVAGKRAGLAGARSGLFMEQIRVIKEMRQHERDIGRANDMVRPRYMVWENVPGAFSSNKGEDFRAVLEETARIADGNADVPQPPNGKWSNAGCIMGNGWSIAWRVHDAQFWGVPQRRRRIALVADFTGRRAGEILFKPEGVSGYTPQGFRSWQGTAGTAEKSTGAAGTICLNDQGGSRMDVTDGVTCTLRAEAHHPPCVMGSAGFCTEHSANARGNGDGSIVPTMTGDHQSSVTDYAAVAVFEPKSALEENWGEATVKNALRAGASKSSHAVVQETYTMQRSDEYQECNVASTQSARQYKSATDLVVENKRKYIIRRLTPLECERLQGYPDGWTDIPGASDSARYKALGNSIALPFWRWMLTRMSTYLPPDATLGSLFDGIGGFPLIWEELHGKGSARWAGEIEPFPIAVTKMRFKEDEPCKVYYSAFARNGAS